jgi:hypothetical protein
MGVDLKRLRREIDSGRTAATLAYTTMATAAATTTSMPAQPRSRAKPIALSVAALLVAVILAYLVRPSLPPPKITGSTQITHDGQQKTFGGQTMTIVLTDGPRLYIQENVMGASSLRRFRRWEGKPSPCPCPFPTSP